jgi:ATP-dependent protease HslVU (ClpYQ) peptidase subunit
MTNTNDTDRYLSNLDAIDRVMAERNAARRRPAHVTKVLRGLARRLADVEHQQAAWLTMSDTLQDAMRATDDQVFRSVYETQVTRCDEMYGELENDADALREDMLLAGFDPEHDGDLFDV